MELCEIANILRSEIRFKLQNYNNIIVVAHSMGGLITKACIIKDIADEMPPNIKLFISLAVPHTGSNLATYGGLIGKDAQIGDLTPLNSYITEINDAWLKTDLRPTTKYFLWYS